jgi:hypothetical protein
MRSVLFCIQKKIGGYPDNLHHIPCFHAQYYFRNRAERSDTTPWMEKGAPCPCGSGKKFKICTGYSKRDAPSAAAMNQRGALEAIKMFRLKNGSAAEQAAFDAGDHNLSHARTVVDDWMSDHEENCDRICSGAVERALRLADERHPPDDDYGEPFGRPIRYTPLCLDRHLERPCEPLIIRGAPDLDAPAVGTLPQREDISVEGWPLGWWLELPANYALIDDGSDKCQ